MNWTVNWMIIKLMMILYTLMKLHAVLTSSLWHDGLLYKCIGVLGLSLLCF